MQKHQRKVANAIKRARFIALIALFSCTFKKHVKIIIKQSLTAFIYAKMWNFSCFFFFFFFFHNKS
ncbi:hypothetical protein NWE60_05010 [Mycoplasmopsis felis]|nr:ribosomal protein S18 [Mycoplasmopsis felis]WAM00790.1 hypothetical protein NWE60_05010 [Mycoplasmopsis felis]